MKNHSTTFIMEICKTKKLSFCISHWHKCVTIYAVPELRKAGLADTKPMCFHSPFLAKVAHC